MTEGFLTPEFVASIAVLITAITGLIVALKGNATGSATHQLAQDNATAVQKVADQTNGTAQALQARIDVLEAHMKTSQQAPVDPAAPQ